jgi:hypothetical protein
MSNRPHMSSVVAKRRSSSPSPTHTAVKGSTIPRQEEVSGGVVHRHGGDIRLIGQVLSQKKGTNMNFQWILCIGMLAWRPS